MAARHAAVPCGIALAVLSICPRPSSAQSEPRLLTPPARQPAAATISEPASTRPSLVTPPVTLPAASATESGSGRLAAPRNLTPEFAADSRSELKITKGSGVLPNEHGQVWREYDISPYTSRVKDADKPRSALDAGYNHSH